MSWLFSTTSTNFSLHLCQSFYSFTYSFYLKYCPSCFVCSGYEKLMWLRQRGVPVAQYACILWFLNHTRCLHPLSFPSIALVFSFYDSKQYPLKKKSDMKWDSGTKGNWIYLTYRTEWHKKLWGGKIGIRGNRTPCRLRDQREKGWHFQDWVN